MAESHLTTAIMFSYNRNAITRDNDRKVAAFVTAKDPAVMKFSKNTAVLIRDNTCPGHV